MAKKLASPNFIDFWQLSELLSRQEISFYSVRFAPPPGADHFFSMNLCTTSLSLRISLIAAVISFAQPVVITRAGQKKQVTPENQIYTPADEKRSRTPAQRKIESQLLYAIKQRRGDPGVALTQTVEVKLDADGRVVVDITAAVPSRVVPEIQQLDGAVISLSEKYHTIRASIALDKLESLAASKHVRFISLPAEAMTHGGATTN